MLSVSVAVAACSVNGTSQPDVSVRLPPAADFPTGVSATPVTGAGLAAVIADVVGDAPGGSVEPSTCAPAALSSNPADSAGLVAQLPAASDLPGTLTVLATRVATPLSAVESQVARCKSFVRTNVAGARSTVRQVLTPAPTSPVSDVSTLGIAATQTTGGSGPGGTGDNAFGVASKSYLAQREGVRVYVVYRGLATSAAAGADPQLVADQQTADLDALFGKAVTSAFGRGR